MINYSKIQIIFQAIKNVGYLMLFLIISTHALAKDQTISGELSLDYLYAGKTTILTVTYQATNYAKVTGLGLRLHYDSSLLEMGEYSDRLRESAQPFQIKDDGPDYDNNVTTDKYFLTSWADTSGDGWPYDAEQPVVLYSVPLTAKLGFNGSDLQFTASSVAAGFKLNASNVSINIDDIPPVISMIGTDIDWARDTNYIDAGATALDNVDGDISEKIILTENVDVSTVGTYSVKYNVTDGNGNEAVEVTRNVAVVDTDTDDDGILDLNDNCVNVANPDQLDTDQDAIGDVCDPDDDNDGVTDILDAFPLDAAESMDTDLDGIGNNADVDDDGDNVPDLADAFPLDPSESMDTDLDGIGNNADTDDDNDGVPDVVDFYPLDASKTNEQLLDIDGNGQVDALTDGLLILRFVFGIRDDILIAGVIGDKAVRTTSAEIEEYLASLIPSLQATKPKKLDQI
jgi:hypothetical protein